MKWNVGAKISAGFGLGLAILLAIGILSLHSAAALAESAQSVTTSHQIIESLGRLALQITNAETRQRGYIITGDEAYVQPYKDSVAAVGKEMTRLGDLARINPRQQDAMQRLEPLVQRRLAALANGVTAQKTGGFEAAKKWTLSGDGESEMDGVRGILAEMENEASHLLKERADEAQATIDQTRLAIFTGTGGAFLLLFAAGFWITRNISAPLREITGATARMAQGDLTANLALGERSDEVGLLARNFQAMTESLRRQIGDLAEGVNILSSSSSQISTSTTQLASSAAETATAVSQTTTTVEEVRQTAQLSSEKSKSVSESAQRMMQISQGGLKSTEEAAAGINRIRRQMGAIADAMVRLSEQSQTIGQIVSSVEDLAAQSNILAVNASIEAARAGEQGKGFAIVALEVRSLAEQSRLATAQVRTILTDIQKATSSAVLATEQGGKAVDAGVKQAGDAGQSIQALSSSVTEATQTATQIAASSTQQLVGVNQVASAMESIKEASTQNVASARQLESAARSLKELGQRLRTTVSHYKL